MNWNCDKNSSAEKAVNPEILLHVGLGFGGGNLNNELESWEEKAVNREILLHVGLGWDFKQ